MVGCVRRTFEEYDLKELAGESPKKDQPEKKMAMESGLPSGNQTWLSGKTPI
jgi:hypothetical protein